MQAPSRSPVPFNKTYFNDILIYTKDFKHMKPKDRVQLRAGPYKSPFIPIGTIRACESRDTDVIVVDYFRWIVVTIEQGQQK